MPTVSADRHIYHREIDPVEHNSLTMLARLVAADSLVLDLGPGTGMLGRLLNQMQSCTVDGVDINSAQNELASPFYRKLHLADLSQVDLPALTDGEKYDYVICADILEHLSEPEILLNQIHAVLKPSGRLLISIPNVGYAGLLAHIMQGDFRYGAEGLLDETHLRFFTRRSLTRLLANSGYSTIGIDALERPIIESEFQRDEIRQLEPALWTALRNLPDALTYQFIVQAKSGISQDPDDKQASTRLADWGYRMQLYWRHDQPGSTFCEESSAHAAGILGAQAELHELQIPASDHRIVELRYDLSDRPGYLRLFRMEVVSSDHETLLCWGRDGYAIGDLAVSGLEIGKGDGYSTVLSLGDDPYLILPIPPEAGVVLQQGGWLRVEQSAPLSADYLAMCKQVMQRDALAVELQQARQMLADKNAELQHEKMNASQYEIELNLMDAKLTGLISELGRLDAQLGQVGARLDHVEEKISDAGGNHERALARLDHVGDEPNQLIAKLNHIDVILGHVNARLSQVALASKQDEARLDRQDVLIKELQHDFAQRRIALERLQRKRAWKLKRFGSILWRLLNRLPYEHGPSFADLPSIKAHQGHAPAASSPVDIIVPVYRGLDETRACLESVWLNPQRTPFELIVIDDCSPEPELSRWLEEKALEERFTLIRNQENMGFVGTVNRGMSLHPDRDVLLLNSDAIVANDWLDRIRDCAYAEQQVATVTPFSNNATICSYPKFCEDNELPDGMDVGAMDSIFAKANPRAYLELPTGVGFCFYIRRTALDEIGLFDVENFGKGYGEENDFCQRAIKRGWKNLLAGDTFVQHLGGVSFAADQHPGKRRALETLARLHPNYEADVHRFVNADPVRPLRTSADFHRLAKGDLPVILAISHSRGGGTQKHVDELAARLAGKAHCLLLQPADGNRLELKWNQPGEVLHLVFSVGTEYRNLIELLKSAGVARIHFHHLLGVPTELWELPATLSVPYDFTLHDFYAACPQISLTRLDNRYCRELGESDCRSCLKAAPAPGGASIEVWRSNYERLLVGADRVFAPSDDTAGRMRRYFPSANILAVPHPETAASFPAPVRPVLRKDEPLKIAVLGALSQIKGADLLEACAEDAAKRGLPLRFELIGFAYRHLATAPKTALTVHGRYEDQHLVDLLRYHGPHMVWFPAVWPETYSYTLSAALTAGLPVAVPDIGAFKERIAGRPYSWQLDWNISAAAMNDWLLTLRGELLAASSDACAAGADSVPPDAYYPVRYLEPVLARAGSLSIELRPWQYEAVQQRDNQAVELLYRLRGHPLLSWMARRIPIHFQRKVKDWLVRH